MSNGNYPPPPGQPPGQQPPGYQEPPGYQPPPPGSQPQYDPNYYGPQPQNDSKAVWSLVLGILSLLLCTCGGFLLAIPAVILGHMSRKTVRESGGWITGDGMALAGLILGYITLTIFVIYIVFYVVVGVSYMDEFREIFEQMQRQQHRY